MKDRFEPGWLPSVALAIVSVFLLVIGISDGRLSTIAIGLFGTVFFGFGAIILELKRRGRVGALASPRRANPSNAEPATRSTTTPSKPPPLSDTDRAVLSEQIKVLGDFGIFAPEVPTVGQLEPAIADYGADLELDSLIGSVFSTPYYDESFELERYTQNLRMHSNKVEQEPDVITSQVSDLVDLSQGALDAQNIVVTFGDGDLVTVTCVLNGEPFEVSYVGANKWLSTTVLHAVSVVYDKLGLPTRFAAIVGESGLYLTLLSRDGAEGLNAAFDTGEPRYDVTVWMDEPSFAFQAGAS